jgi:DNA-directed RNA polymerase specialized sigma24 family protein
VITNLRTSSDFPDTQWSLVNKVNLPGKEGIDALSELCRRYWFPVYSYMRGTGASPEDAEDLTQSFFGEQMDEGLFHKAKSERGMLRYWMLVSLRNFRMSVATATNAKKRGGGARLISFDANEAELAYAKALVDNRDPEKIYIAAWAHSVVARARQRLRHRESLQKANVAAISVELDAYLDLDEGAAPYAELAERFNVNEGKLRQQLRRLRQKFADLMRDEVRKTVDSPDQVEEELHWLINSLRCE